MSAPKQVPAVMTPEVLAFLTAKNAEAAMVLITKERVEIEMGGKVVRTFKGGPTVAPGLAKQLVADGLAAWLT